MPTLRDREPQTEYRTDEANLVDSFYIPCLQTSESYFRAVGYFTGSGLDTHVPHSREKVLTEGRALTLIRR